MSSRAHYKKPDLPSRDELQAEVDDLRLQLARTEQELKTRDENLQAINRELKLGYWEWDEVNNCQIYCTDEVAKIFGENPQNVKQNFNTIDDFSKWVHPDDLEFYLSYNDPQHRRELNFEKGLVYDYRIIDNSGRTRYLREIEFGKYGANDQLVTSYGIIQDVTEFREIVEALSRSEQRYSTFYHELPLGVQEEDYSAIKRVLDKITFQGVENLEEYLQQHPRLLREMVMSSKFTGVNQALLDIHRATSKEQFLGVETDIDSWWDAEWDVYYSRKIVSLYHHGYYETEHVDSRIDHSLFEARVISRVMPGSEHDWSRVVTIHEDISERKKVEQELLATTELAEKASRAKSEFLSSMNHELRTPLNAILGFTELLEYDPAIGDKQRKVIDEISRAGKHLSELINQVLDLSMIEAGEVVISLEPVEIAPVIEECMAWMTPLAKKAAIELDLDEASLSTTAVNVDLVRLKQIFLNLLSNAIKYNKVGGSVSVYCEQEAPGEVRIAVKDSGIGIDTEQMDSLFEPFNRLGAEFSDIEGSGIGLDLSRKLVESMNGSLQVESTLGVGSTFWLTLPAAGNSVSMEHISLDDAPMATPASAGQSSRLLVVEDNPVNLDLIATQIELLGYQADFANNGVEALERWQSGHYAMVLTDVRMAGMDGFELTRKIRQLESAASRCSVVAVTANALPDDVDQCYRAGMDDVLSKPLMLDDLQQMLQKWLKQTDSAADDPPSPTTTVMQAFDISVLQRATGDKPGLHQKLLADFQLSLPGLIGEVQQAFHWKNHGRLSEHSHKLKSSARSLGLGLLADACERLETVSNNANWEEIERLVPLLQQNAELASEVLSPFLKDAGNPEPVETTCSETTDFSLFHDERDLAVLLVDDDYVMHRVTTVILNDLGISRVSNAISGSSALKLLEEQPALVDVVICDLNMPGMDGIEFLRHLAGAGYGGAVILVSGEDARILRTVERLAAENDLYVLGTLQKPVDPKQLSELLSVYDQNDPDGTVLNFATVSVSQLAEALQDDQIDVHFQPKIEISSGRIMGVEALARWQHPHLGLIRPDIFVRLAEENGLIGELTDRVCCKVVQYAARLQAQDVPLKFAINISVDALTNLDWPDRITQMLEESGLKSSSISFEVTETRLMDNLSVALDIISRLSLKHFELSIDDFGTGYSSMEQLQRIPFSELKIDRAFVHGATDDSAARAILESNVILARKLGMKVVAEGVEDQRDWDLVAELGCDLVQGYFVSRPLPFDQLCDWLRTQKT